MDKKQETILENEKGKEMDKKQETILENEKGKENDIVLNDILDETSEYLATCAKKEENKNFNIFIVEEIVTEVKMCKFLQAILSPYYNPRYATKMIVSFLIDVIGFDEKIVGNGEDWFSVHEFRIDDGRRIDIALINMEKNAFVPIEAKIGAKDQLKQCKDYIDYAEKKFNFQEFKLCYLTICGGFPSAYSCTSEYHEKIVPITWEHIHEWLLVEIDSKDDIFKHCIVQYCVAIEQFIKKEKGKIKMIEIINTKEKFVAAEYICGHINDIKKQKMIEFFEKLECQLDEAVKEINLEDKILTKVELFGGPYKAIQEYYTKRTRPGITYFVDKTKLKEEYQNAFDKHSLAFRIEVDDNLFVAACSPLDDNSKDESIIRSIGINKNNFSKLESVFPSQSKLYKESDWWLEWKYIKNDKKELFNFKKEEDSVFKHLFLDKEINELVNLTVKKFIKYYREVTTKILE